MSKLGKKPIMIPKDAKVKFESGKIILTGPKGSKQLSINDKIFTATVSENNILSLKQKPYLLQLRKPSQKPLLHRYIS